MPSNTETLGLQDGDLVDLDLDAADYENLFDGEESELEREYQSVLNREVEEKEIEKFGAEVFKQKLENILLREQ